MINNLTDQNNLASSSDFPFAKFPFEHFNPVQSRVFDIYDKGDNCLIAAPTASGKTVCAELYLSHEIRKRGGKGLYLAPLRALSQEKYDDWTDSSHHFSDLKVSICTGDYRLTAQRKEELEAANMIIMTSELLNSRARNYRLENNKFLKEVNTLCIDEAHLISSPDRGSHLESGIMKFIDINPNARIVLLSATMPNVEQLAGWISKLTKRSTNVIQSIYRPCPLNVHWEKYYSTGSYSTDERAKVDAAIDIIRRHPKDKFLFFVHTKRTGKEMLDALKDRGITCEYHNADLTKEKRKAIEKKFKEGDLRAIVATSTLSTGLNLPARRVVILGVHRGMSLVESSEVQQGAGRAGRPKYDPCGDAYVLLPMRNYADLRTKMMTPVPIQSQMNGKALAFHLVSEIHHRDIENTKDVHSWYQNTFAHHQNKVLDDGVIDEVITRLSKCGAIREKDGNYEATNVGTISSLFYYSPYDVADIAKNFSSLFKSGKEENDLSAVMALANTDAHRGGIVSNAEREEVEEFRRSLRNTYADGAVKVGACYHNLMNGKKSEILGGLMRTLGADFDRLYEILIATDGMVGKWGKKDYFNTMKLRMQYGVAPEFIDLVRVRGIGKVRAERLWDFGIRSASDVKDPLKIMKALGCSKAVAEQFIQSARELG